MTDPLYRIAPQDHPAAREGMTAARTAEEIAQFLSRGRYHTDWLRIVRLVRTGRPALVRIPHREPTEDDPKPSVSWAYILRDPPDQSATFTRIEELYGDLAKVMAEIESAP